MWFLEQISKFLTHQLTDIYILLFILFGYLRFIDQSPELWVSCKNPELVKTFFLNSNKKLTRAQIQRNSLYTLAASSAYIYSYAPSSMLVVYKYVSKP